MGQVFCPRAFWGFLNAQGHTRALSTQRGGVFVKVYKKCFRPGTLQSWQQQCKSRHINIDIHSCIHKGDEARCM